MDTRSRLAESRDEVSDTDGLTPQERLQRLADAFEAEQDWSDRLVRETFGPEQSRPIHTPPPVRIEPAPTSSAAWRNLKLFLAIVVVVTAAAGALLQFVDPPRARPEASPSLVATAPPQPALTPAPTPIAPAPLIQAPSVPAVSPKVAQTKPATASGETKAPIILPDIRPMTHFVTKVPSSDASHLPGTSPTLPSPTTPSPVIQPPAQPTAPVQSLPSQNQVAQNQATQDPVKQSTDPAPALTPPTPAPIPLPAPVTIQAPAAGTAPPPPDTPRQEAPKPIVLPPRTSTVAANPPAKASAVDTSSIGDAEAAILIYYPPGSPLGEANARNLAARIGSSSTSFDFRPETNVPAVAVVRFSDAKGHALARTIGKALTSMVYSWKIESAPSSDGSQQRVVEVWLPIK